MANERWTLPVFTREDYAIYNGLERLRGYDADQINYVFEAGLAALRARNAEDERTQSDAEWIRERAEAASAWATPLTSKQAFELLRQAERLDTEAAGSREAAYRWLEKNYTRVPAFADWNALLPTEFELSLIRALGRRTMARDAIAKVAGYQPAGCVCDVLTNLCKDGVLHNLHDRKGYWLDPAYYYLLD